MKRMLAYSSVAHAGFILLGVLAMSENGASGTMFYLLTYGMATIGAFAILTLIRKGDGEASHVSDWAGLAKRSPVLAASMSLFLLSFAGIPLTSGFIGKLSVFTAAMESGYGGLVVLAMIATAVTAFFYLRIVVVMYFSEPVTAKRPVTVGGASASGGGLGIRHRRAVCGPPRGPDGDRHRGGGDRHARARHLSGSGARLAEHSAPAAVVMSHTPYGAPLRSGRTKPDIGSSA